MPDPAIVGITANTFSSISCWLQILAVVLLSLGLRFVEKGFKTAFYPDDVTILAEKELSSVKGKNISCLPKPFCIKQK